ncbi:amphi-Trp domain-containing protein [Streptomyces sp. NBC_01343]|uniref:amphi-Trp domain-containing protein n=1 Tax=Streptomyces sp. NBC_01343 TaxID=2903832 RepID=UPI002E11FC0D|nr:amphi-Trp domain-containing protein [Streptomyces sp. NBC_01343]
MTDLKFEQKRSLSRIEAADQLTALAAMMREGGDVELELVPGTLSLRIPDDLRSEIEVEVGDGQIELEIEFKWPTTPRRPAPPHTAASTEKTPRRKNAAAAAAEPDRNSTRTSRSKTAKRAATKTP